jgi:hypothetical protein
VLFQRIFKKLTELLDVYGTPVDSQILRWVSGNSRAEWKTLQKTHENIKDYGAIGDGVANDTAAIAAAIAAAKAAGGTRRVYIPPGRYLTDKITGISSNMIVYGAGTGDDGSAGEFGRASVLKSRTGDHVIEITTPSSGINIKLHDFEIHGAGTNASPIPAGTGCGIYLHDTVGANYGLHWSDLFIRYCGGHGICFGTQNADPRPTGLGDTNGQYSCYFTRITIWFCGDHHWRISNTGPGFSIQDYLFFYTPPTGTYSPDGRGFGLYIAAGEFNLTCINGDTQNTPTGNHTYLGGGCHAFVFDSGRVENYPYTGLYLESAAGIIRNTHFSLTTNGIYGDAAPRSIYVKGNNTRTLVLENNRFTTLGIPWVHNEALHVEGIYDIAVIGAVPATFWEESTAQSRNTARLTTIDGTGGKDFSLGSTAAVSNTPVKRDASANITTNRFVASASSSGGVIIADANVSIYRDDDNTTGAQFSCVITCAGASNRQFVFRDRLNNENRMGLYAGSLTGSSGIVNNLSITPRVNQSGTAGYNALFMDVSEDATGSGAKNLANLSVGGVSKFRVSNAGGPGFYGTAPVAKPAVTGSRGGNAALASLLTALASTGLVTDSSSA